MVRIGDDAQIGPIRNPTGRLLHPGQSARDRTRAAALAAEIRSWLLTHIPPPAGESPVELADPAAVELAASQLRQLLANTQEPRLGGLWDGTGADGEALNPVMRVETQIRAMELCAALDRSMGGLEWRKAWRELALVVAARAYQPEQGLLVEQWSAEGGMPVRLAGPALQFHAAWIFGRSADRLEEPGLADLGGRILTAALALPAAARDPGWYRLAAIAHYYRRRPASWMLGVLEASWRQAEGGDGLLTAAGTDELSLSIAVECSRSAAEDSSRPGTAKSPRSVA